MSLWHFSFCGLWPVWYWSVQSLQWVLWEVLGLWDRLRRSGLVPLSSSSGSRASWSHILGRRGKCLSGKVAAAWHCVSGCGCEGWSCPATCFGGEKNEFWTSSAELVWQLWRAGYGSYNPSIFCSLACLARHQYSLSRVALDNEPGRSGLVFHVSSKLPSYYVGLRSFCHPWESARLVWPVTYSDPLCLQPASTNLL